MYRKTWKPVYKVCEVPNFVARKAPIFGYREVPVYDTVDVPVYGTRQVPITKPVCDPRTGETRPGHVRHPRRTRPGRHAPGAPSRGLAHGAGARRGWCRQWVQEGTKQKSILCGSEVVNDPDRLPLRQPDHGLAHRDAAVRTVRASQAGMPRLSPSRLHGLTRTDARADGLTGDR